MLSMFLFLPADKDFQQRSSCFELYNAVNRACPPVSSVNTKEKNPLKKFVHEREERASDGMSYLLLSGGKNLNILSQADRKLSEGMLQNSYAYKPF